MTILILYFFVHLVGFFSLDISTLNLSLASLIGVSTRLQKLLWTDFKIIDGSHVYVTHLV